MVVEMMKTMRRTRRIEQCLDPTNQERNALLLLLPSPCCCSCCCSCHQCSCHQPVLCFLLLLLGPRLVVPVLLLDVVVRRICLGRICTRLGHHHHEEWKYPILFEQIEEILFVPQSNEFPRSQPNPNKTIGCGCCGCCWVVVMMTALLLAVVVVVVSLLSSSSSECCCCCCGSSKTIWPNSIWNTTIVSQFVNGKITIQLLKTTVRPLR